MTHLTNAQARQFLFRWHGLLGDHRFAGKEGALAYIRQCGCIQFDPVDVCGRNADLSLQSRVKNYSPAMLEALLYRDRLLFDYPDKNQAILPTEDWPYFSRYRRKSQECAKQFEGLAPLTEQAVRYIGEHGPVCSSDLPIKGEIFWHSCIHWSGNWHKPSNAARSVLEQLYADGLLIVHHKEDTRKYYDLASKHLSPALLDAKDPLPDDETHLRWRILRRISAVGLLWNRSSDAWLNIAEQQSGKLDPAKRTEAFRQLSENGLITEVAVEGIRGALYCPTAAIPILEEITSGKSLRPRCEALAPLDCLLWDRKLIRALFGFDYTWEIYTPEAKRKYGYYVLPLIYGDRFIGRLEASADRRSGVLTLRHIWFEQDVRVTKTLQKAIDGCIRRLANMNGCSEILDSTKNAPI